MRPIPILLYHSVCDDPPPPLARWSVSTRSFECQLELVLELGCTTWTVSQLAAALRLGAPIPASTVIVTFDDGYADFAEQALPRLEARAVASTIYLTTGALGGMRDPVVPRMPIAPMLSLRDLAALEERGVELGAHGHGHWQLDALPERRAAYEIVRSKVALEEVLGHEVASFAYPHGYSSGRVRRLVTEAGFSSACAVRNAFSSPADNPFALARLTVERDTPLEVVRAWLSGSGAPIATDREALKTQVWRWYRRATLLPSLPARPAAMAAAPERSTAGSGAC